MSDLVQPGSTVDGYRLEALLGRGAARSVWRARSKEGGTPVALKLLEALDLNKPAMRARFLREAEFLASVSQPSVVKIQHAATVGARPYLVMEMLSGVSLREQLAVGALSRGELMKFGDELLDALASIHEAGIVHRDLTPSNLMCTPQRLVVVDFGLARLVGDAILSRSRGIVATLAYSPPERIQGHAHTRAGDVYQAGLVLFEMATGRVPFPEGAPSALATAHMLTPPPLACSLRKDLPELLDRVLDRALRKNPADRYRGIRLMQRDWRFLWKRSRGSR